MALASNKVPPRFLDLLGELVTPACGNSLPKDLHQVSLFFQGQLVRGVEQLSETHGLSSAPG